MQFLDLGLSYEKEQYFITSYSFKKGRKWLRAPLTFLHATSGIELEILYPEPSALTTRPLHSGFNDYEIDE